MSRCPDCEPEPDCKVEFCPCCAANLRDPHKPACAVRWLETIYREHPDIFPWFIRREGGIPAEDILLHIPFEVASVRLGEEWQQICIASGCERVPMNLRPGMRFVVLKEWAMRPEEEK